MGEAIKIERVQDSFSFGAMVRQERKALGMTQEDLADRLQVRRQTIADLENGKNVGSHILFAVLSHLGKLVQVTDARPDLDAIRSLVGASDD